ncbi:MAG: PIN domain-containing protein [Bryobacterales bacterium]|nr:PIN domain-containing protein [Bryobacterales bacterium]MBV9399235.1 PIN domain-containing protein [Bryobacterales bacterium]
MAIIADAGGVYGLLNRRDSAHAKLRAAVEQARDRIVIPAPVLGEIDYLLRARIGTQALLRFLSDVQIGAFNVEPLTTNDLERCSALMAKYSNLDLGLNNASVVAIAERLHSRRILTVDERDFRAVVPSSGKPFRLLPADDSPG